VLVGHGTQTQCPAHPFPLSTGRMAQQTPWRIYLNW